MNIKLIDSVNDFVRLKEDYTKLIGDCKNLTPFFSHRWLAAWWGAFQKKCRGLVFCIYEKENLVLAIPLQFGKGTFGKVGVKKVCFMGGNWGLFDIPVSENTAKWGKQFLLWLFGKDIIDWDLFQFGPLRDRSTHISSFLSELKGSGVEYKVSKKDNPYLPLRTTWEEFLAAKSKNFRRTIKRKEKKVQEDSSFEYRRMINPRENVLKETIFEITNKSWQGKAGVAVASSKEGRIFYELLVKGSGEFDFDLSAIYSEGKCVAYLLGFKQNRVYHAFDTGFDPAYSEYSPGLFVHIYALRELFRDDVEEFNFGYDHSYKERFEPTYHNSLEIVVFRNHLIKAYDKIIRGARVLLNRL